MMSCTFCKQKAEPRHISELASFLCTTCNTLYYVNGEIIMYQYITDQSIVAVHIHPEFPATNNYTAIFHLLDTNHSIPILDILMKHGGDSPQYDDTKTKIIFLPDSIIQKLTPTNIQSKVKHF